MNILTSRATTKINIKDITNKGWGGILQKYSVNPTTGREQQRIQIEKKNDKMVSLNPAILTTTWKVRRQNIALEEIVKFEWGKYQDPTVCCLLEI